MKCYFCQEELSDVDNNGFFYCEECPKKITSGKGMVIHVTDAQGLLYAHIYIDRHTELGIRHFHFRLHIREGYTNFAIPEEVEYFNGDFNDICKITGFPVNPFNADEKLSLYLLFS